MTPYMIEEMRTEVRLERMVCVLETKAHGFWKQAGMLCGKIH